MTLNIFLPKEANLYIYFRLCKYIVPRYSFLVFASRLPQKKKNLQIILYCPNISDFFFPIFSFFLLFVSMTRLLNCVLHWTLGEEEINKLYIKKIGIWNCLTHSCDSIDSCDYYSNGRFSISLYTPPFPVPPVLFFECSVFDPFSVILCFLDGFLYFVSESNIWKSQSKPSKK